MSLSFPGDTTKPCSKDSGIHSRHVCTTILFKVYAKYLLAKSKDTGACTWHCHNVIRKLGEFFFPVLGAG